MTYPGQSTYPSTSLYPGAVDLVSGPFTAEPQPGNTPPRVRIDFDWPGASDEAWIMRLDPDGRQRPVRLAEPAPLVGGTWTGFDYEAPFGVPVRYLARVGGTIVATTDALTLDVDQAWLRHPGVPDLSMPMRCTVAEFQPEQLRASRGVFDVVGASYPIVITDGARKSAESGMVLRTETANELARLRAIIADCSVLLLSIPPSWEWGITHDYVSIGDVQIARQLQYGPDQTRDISVPYTVVGRPAGGLQAQWTWAGVIAEFSSHAELSASYASLADLLANKRIDL